MKESIEERIEKCNDREHRQLLYELESITGMRLSFLDPFERISQSSPKIDKYLFNHKIVISEKECLNIKTIEDFIDRIIIHRRFIESFKDGVLHNTPVDPVGNNDPYDLETRIQEVENVFSIDVQRDTVQSIDNLVQFVIDNNTVLKEVFDAIVEQLDLDPKDVTLSSKLYHDLGADSLDFVELLMNAERKYGIRIPDEETSGITTVEDVYKVVLRKMNKPE